MTYDLLRLVVDPDSPCGEVGQQKGACLRPQSRNRMLQALLVHHFSLFKMLARDLMEGE